jgi:uncharacterized lipoprotein YddW (UPF0748 family)
MIRRSTLPLLCSALLALPAAAQVACELSDPSCLPPRVAREFRGVWIASVDNIDWPSRPGLSPDSVKRELITLLDHARRSGLNAVILQVRPAGDALYASELEPWSEYLTGRQGVAPKPWWDPLKFAVEEAHRRGLELHAWFNPYRARHSSAKSLVSRSHISARRPALVRTYGRQKWMDPGEAAVREHTVKVILDVVKRYDIDGVHIDDYLYPYKERDRRGRTIDFPDSVTYARYRAAGGILARDDWRRENVDRLVEQLYTEIRATKPWVKFGISPFGIWRPGFPEQVVGFDAYAELYADARKWLREGWVDYLAPQLYWPVSAPAQPYDALLRWWAEQNAYGRHLWPGNYASKVAERSRTAWRAAEIVDQVAVTRAEAGASGNIHFSAKVFAENRDSLASRLVAQVYAEPALVPPSPWMAVPPAGEPTITVKRAAGGRLTASLTPAAGEVPRWWLVQVRGRDGAWSSTLLRGTTREVPLAAASDRLAVRPLDRAAIEGPMQVIKLNDD